MNQATLSQALGPRFLKDKIKNFHLVRMLFIGFASEEQMQYDENVLNYIVKEFGSIPRSTKPSDESWIINADSAVRG
jgi:hypothetical protein